MKRLIISATLLAFAANMIPIAIAEEIASGRWKYEESTDRMTDEVIYRATYASGDGILFTWCKNGTVFLSFTPTSSLAKVRFINMDDMIEVQWRVGSGQMVIDQWHKFMGTESNFAAISRNNWNLIDQIIQGNGSFLMRFYGITFEVLLDGAKETVGRMRDACAPAVR